jgi:hypothetical protein
LAIVLAKLGESNADDLIARSLDALATRIGISHPAVDALGHGKLLHRIVEPHPF